MIALLWAVALAGRVVSPAPAPLPSLPSALAPPSAEALLGLRDRAVDPAEWRALGPAVLPRLEALAIDPAALPTRRARALEGAVALDSRRVPELVLRLAAAGQPFVVRLAAIQAASVLDPARRLALLRPLLRADPDEQIRGAAAVALSGQPQGCAAVRARAGAESAPWRARFGEALARCGARP